MNLISKKLKSHNLQACKGFTLLETLLVIALVALIFVAGMPVYLSLMFRNDLAIGQNTTASLLRRAQLLSQGVDGDSGWGAKIQSGSITLFQGASYASRNTTRDEIHEIPSSINVAGAQEIVYAKFTGLPSATGTITFTASNNETSTVTINGKGTISY
ncbi:type II secretion system protein [Candidatus Uhrbacteria bacterium]|nr:type II secretion system protein [Candidatus Uhrbacteria bacterium]